MSSTQKVIKYAAIALAFAIIFSCLSAIVEIVYSVGSGIKIDSSISNTSITEYASTAKILHLDIKTSKVIIKIGSSLKVKTNNKFIESQQINNKLFITETKTNIFSNKNKGTVTIYIPKDIEFDNVEIALGASSILVESLTTKNFNFEVGAGKVSINNLFVTNKADIDGGVGKIDIKNSSINNLELDMGVGKVTINSVLLGKNKVEAGVGKLTLNLLDGKDNYTTRVSKGIGSINIDGKDTSDNNNYGTGKNTIDLEGGIGAIDINFK